jgi:hypothetical protein
MFEKKKEKKIKIEKYIFLKIKLFYLNKYY